jgi:hypothetical protein
MGSDSLGFVHENPLTSFLLIYGRSNGDFGNLSLRPLLRLMLLNQPYPWEAVRERFRAGLFDLQSLNQLHWLELPAKG